MHNAACVLLMLSLAWGCTKDEKEDETGDGEDGGNVNSSGGGGGGGGVDCKTVPIKQVTLPVDFAASSDIYPFGIHGNTTNHPEGHPGFDLFYSTALPVKAPFTGTVTETYPSGHGTAMCLAVMAEDGCNWATYCGLDLTVKKDDAVQDGGDLGTIHLVPDAAVSTLHISYNNTRDAGFPPCTSKWIDPEMLRCVVGAEAGQEDPTDCSTVPLRAGGTLMKKWTGMAAGPRTVTCADGSSQTYEAPAETGLCAAPLDAALRAEIYACVGLGDDRWN